MDAPAYLARIGLEAAPPLDHAGLETLQRSHLTHVPFENLDVYHRRGVSTDPDRAVTKIVEGRRGGWCFELNGAFASLLEALGFAVTRLGATVVLRQPTAGPQPSHAAIRVDLDHPYLVDVGFGDSFIRPLRLDEDGPQDGGTGRYQFRRDGGPITLSHLDGDRWADQYRFTLDPVTPADFDPSNEYLQTPLTTDFTRAPFVTRLLGGGPGRVTLLHDRLKTRSDGVWSEQPVTPTEWPALLAHWFGMEP
ncbi:MAG TPA: arylamine N-acetyltransferase [Acidimicrobiia bacterium]